MCASASGNVIIILMDVYPLAAMFNTLQGIRRDNCYYTYKLDMEVSPFGILFFTLFLTLSLLVPSPLNSSIYE